VANEKATLYIAMKLPIGRWTVKSLPRNRALQDCVTVAGNKRLDSLNRRDVLRFVDWMRGNALYKGHD
jgi:hypothetical protein